MSEPSGLKWLDTIKTSTKINKDDTIIVNPPDVIHHDEQINANNSSNNVSSLGSAPNKAQMPASLKSDAIHCELSDDGSPLIVDGKKYDPEILADSAKYCYRNGKFVDGASKQAFLNKICAAFGFATSAVAVASDEEAETLIDDKKISVMNVQKGLSSNASDIVNHSKPYVKAGELKHGIVTPSYVGQKHEDRSEMTTDIRDEYTVDDEG